MKKTRRPPMLTVDGKTQTASTHQKVASYIDAVTSIRRGLVQARKGEGRSADEVFAGLEQEDSIR